jgi:hypothetical protein
VHHLGKSPAYTQTKGLAEGKLKIIPHVTFALKDFKMMETSDCHFWLMSDPHKRDEKLNTLAHPFFSIED